MRGLKIGLWFGLLTAALLSEVRGADLEPLPPPRESAEMTRRPDEGLVYTIDGALAFGLANNPDLAALRQQHGIAAAGVVIAREYPFNPVYESRLRGVNGPGVTNHFAQEHTVLLELEVRRQKRYRLQEANATLTRTDWEIATQELAAGVRIVRAFDTTVYRKDKLRLVEETLTLDREIANRVEQLVRAGRLRGAESILARTETDDVWGLLNPGRLAISTSISELRRAMGLVNEPVDVEGTLDRPFPGYQEVDVMQAALKGRPDLRARQAALAEADARLRLSVANRFGNPTLGPTYELNETADTFFGAQLAIPIPILNAHRGEIMQRRAERARAALDLREAEIAVRQDVHAALVRLDNARAAVQAYQDRILPNLRGAMRDMQTLFNQGDPGVDVLRVIDVHRRLLRAQDGYIDAMFELSQARADLAAAVGDPTAAFLAAWDPAGVAGACGASWEAAGQ